MKAFWKSRRWLVQTSLEKRVLSNCRILCHFEAVPLKELDARLRGERRPQPFSRNGKYISGWIRGNAVSVDPNLSQQIYIARLSNRRGWVGRGSEISHLYASLCICFYAARNSGFVRNLFLAWSLSEGLWQRCYVNILSVVHIILMLLFFDQRLGNSLNIQDLTKRFDRQGHRSFA